MRKILPLLLGALLVMTGVAHAAAKEKTDAKLNVFVSILPQPYFVERIGGDHVEVGVLVGPGKDIHTFDPSPKTMAELAKARILFRVGLPFEHAVIKKVGSAFKGLEIVDTRKGIPLRSMSEAEMADDDGHDHGKAAADKHGHKKAKAHAHSQSGKDAHEHKVGEQDPHIWLDPKLVKIQAATIAEALAKADPANAEEYRKNCEAFVKDLDAVDERISRVLAPLKGKPVFVYHPAYGYFADAYGLKQVSVEVGGKEPGAAHMKQLIERAKKEGARVIFVQPQFSGKSADTIARAIQGAAVTLDPLAKDYLNNLNNMAAQVEKGVAQESQPSEGK